MMQLLTNWGFLYLLCGLVVIVQSKTTCDSITPKFPRCKDVTGVYSKKDTNGHLCPEKDNPEHRCKPISSWCNVKYDSSYPKYQCSGFDNSIFSSCFTWDFELDLADKGLTEYKYVKAAVDWTVAESFCQSHDSHLVNLDSQQEADLLKHLLLTLHNRPSKWIKNSSFTFSDPAQAVCKPISSRHNRDPKVWLGLYYDFKSSQWQNSDGSKFSEDVNVGRKSDFHLGDLYDISKDRIQPPCYMTWDVEKGAHFVQGDKYPRLGVQGTTGNVHDGNAILCEKAASPSRSRWEGRFSSTSDNSKCLTGFHCPGNCLIGPQYDNSQLCDGVSSCPDGEDEDLSNCPHISQKLDGGGPNRVYIFLPPRRTYAEKVAICKSLGLYLPIIRSKADVGILKFMAQNFGKSKSGKDFQFQQQIWNQSDSEAQYIPLGRIYGQLTWPDGSAVKFSKLPDEVQSDDNRTNDGNVEKVQQFVALNLLQTSNNEKFIAKNSDDAHRSYTICEGDSEVVVSTNDAKVLGPGGNLFYFVIMFFSLLHFAKLSQRLDSNNVLISTM